jgi:DNA-binding transcriptional LysR family regulator
MSASISIGALRAFVVTARSRDLSEAAQNLGIPRRSLIHILRKLERQLEVPLCMWEHDSVTLTESGTIFVEPATLVLRVLGQAMGQMGVSLGVGQCFAAEPARPQSSKLPSLRREAPNEDV